MMNHGLIKKLKKTRLNGWLDVLGSWHSRPTNGLPRHRNVSIYFLFTRAYAQTSKYTLSILPKCDRRMTKKSSYGMPGKGLYINTSDLHNASEKRNLGL
jgi:hypothetical protein